MNKTTPAVASTTAAQRDNRPSGHLPVINDAMGIGRQVFLSLLREKSEPSLSLKLQISVQGVCTHHKDFQKGYDAV